MSITRTQAFAAVALSSVLALAGCGSDNTSGDTGSSSGSESSAAAKISDCFSGTLDAEGSSAQKNAIESAIKGYQEACSGATINYNPSGSGAGVKNFNAGQVDFAGSDSALKADKGEVDAAKAQCKSDAWNIPMVVGPISISYNVPGVEGLVLDGPTAAKIFSGAIKKWNDPAIAKLNADAKLPDTDIKVFFRSDESGTTDNFTKYLKAAGGGDWKTEPAKKWAGSVGEGKEKSAGVASAVKSTEGGVTYVEWSYAQQNQLQIAKIDNGGGATELSSESVGKMIATAKQKGTGNDLSLDLDYATKEAGAYPITLVTYEIVCSKYPDAAKAKEVKSFLTYFAGDDMQKSLEKEGYAPLPADVATKVKTAVAAIS